MFSLQFCLTPLGRQGYLLSASYNITKAYLYYSSTIGKYTDLGLLTFASKICEGTLVRPESKLFSPSLLGV